MLSVTNHGFVFWAQREPNAILEIYKAFQDRLTFLNRRMIVSGLLEFLGFVKFTEKTGLSRSFSILKTLTSYRAHWYFLLFIHSEVSRLSKRMVGFILLLVVLYCWNYLDYKYYRYSVNWHEMDTSQTYLVVFVVFLNMNFKVKLRVKSLVLLSIEEPSIGHFDISFPPLRLFFSKCIFYC